MQDFISIKLFDKITTKHNCEVSIVENKNKITMFTYNQNHAEVHYPNKVFKGIISNGMMQGEGNLKFQNGIEYRGHFKDNFMNGNCEIYY